MLKNIFITGTDSDLINYLGNNTDVLSDSFYHAVSSRTVKTTHSSHLGTFTAPLVCAYARTHLPYIASILIALRIPSIPPIDAENDKPIEHSFHTEWYFTIDLLRQSLLLLRQNTHNYTDIQKEHVKNRIYITIPYVHPSKLNDAQTMYYNSITSAVKAFIHSQKNPYDVVLLYLETQYQSPEYAKKLLERLDKYKNTRLFRKVRHLKPWIIRLFKI